MSKWIGGVVAAVAVMIAVQVGSYGAAAPAAGPRNPLEAVLRQQRRDRFLRQRPGTTIVGEMQLIAHPETDFRSPEDWRLVKRSDGATMIELGEHLTVEQLANPRAYLPPATVTYVDLRTGVYRTFVQAGPRPTAAETQRILDQLRTDGQYVPMVRPQARARQDAQRQATALARAEAPHWPARPRVGDLLRTLLGRTTELFAPSVNAQGSCYGQWYGVIGTQDPVGYDLNQLYPILQWGLNPTWYAYGNWSYWNAYPSGAGTYWYFDGGQYKDWNPPTAGGPPNNAGWVWAQADFHNTDFPPSGGAPVYVDLQDSIWRNQDRSMTESPSFSAWGAPTAGLLKNIPTGYFALNYQDSCP